jgi:hypothetical protein
MPTGVSIRVAGLSMLTVANEIDRFPIFELPDQGSRSVARHLVAVAGQLKLTDLILEKFATDLGEREGSADDQQNIRDFVGGQLKLVEAILEGKELKRP